MATRRLGSWARSSILFTFLAVAVPLTLVVTITTFALLEASRSQTQRTALDERMVQLAQIQATALSGPVWNYNQPQIELILGAVVNDPDLIGLRVVDDKGALLGEVGIGAGDGVKSAKATIFYSSAQTSRSEIGEITLFYTGERLAAETRQAVRTAVVVIALLALAMIVSALAALHYAVRKPLHRFATAIREAQHTHEFVAVGLGSTDEIGLVAEAYDDLQARQKSDEAELRRIQDNLESLVDARTRELGDAVEALTVRETELIRARDEAENALVRLRTTQDRLVQSEKMASLGQLTAGIAHEIKNPLNFVNNFSSLSTEHLEDLEDILYKARDALGPEAAEEAADLIANVNSNLRKIREHGGRADTIVRNMLLHSRHGPSTLQKSPINAILDEARKLSFHSARAEIEGFNVDMHTDLDPGVGEIDCYPQDLSRVFINVISNGMYAAHARRATAPAGFLPHLSVSTRDRGSFVEVRITDNGGGVPPEVADRIFTPFFTTKPAGEGTGLGLSISYDIVVTQHGGDISVESQDGEGTTFVITVPKTQAEANAEAREGQT